jgi:5-(carboxyamino)imidazole ribonucleotide synthase
MPDALPPGSTIGIMGGGQLGRMLAMAAARLGLKTYLFADEANAPAFDVAAFRTLGDFADLAAIENFAGSVDVVTCEFENVPAAALEAAARAARVYPPPNAFAVAQDRLIEKSFLRELGIPVAPFAPVGSAAELERALDVVKLPALLKTRRFGYDGKGQVLLRGKEDANAARAELQGAPAIAEGLITFSRELSVLVVRGRDGTMQFYDTVENVHEHGILATSRVPAPIPASVAFEARAIAGKIAEALGHVGVLAVEMFHCESGAPSLLVNEIAPRVHNSGHWTLDACLVSQFENHMRAICGWPLGETSRHSDAVMTNLIGDEVERWQALVGEEGVALHLYGKRDARPGRKMGHFTRLTPKT